MRVPAAWEGFLELVLDRPSTFAPVRLAALVAQRSEARLLTPAVSAAAQLATFSDEETAVTAALIYAQMTAGRPDGSRVDLQDRLADIHARHANENTDLFAARMSRGAAVGRGRRAGERGWPVCVDELRHERLNPPIDRHVVHDNAALCE